MRLGRIWRGTLISEQDELRFLLKVFREDFGGVRGRPMWACPSDSYNLFSSFLKALDDAERVGEREIVAPRV